MTGQLWLRLIAKASTAFQIPYLFDPTVCRVELAAKTHKIDSTDFCTAIATLVQNVRAMAPLVPFQRYLGIGLPSDGRTEKPGRCSMRRRHADLKDHAKFEPILTCVYHWKTAPWCFTVSYGRSIDRGLKR